MINTAVAENATFVSDNWFVGSGSIGLFGRSRGTDFSIGVLGQSAQGCAVYGLATDSGRKRCVMSEETFTCHNVSA